MTTLAGSSIKTNGPNAVGINALSLGGNGGHGGMAVETGVNAQFTDEVPAGNASLTFGGDGHTGGSSGAVTVSNQATISTGDFNSHGIQGAVHRGQWWFGWYGDVGYVEHGPLQPSGCNTCCRRKRRQRR